MADSAPPPSSGAPSVEIRNLLVRLMGDQSNYVKMLEEAKTATEKTSTDLKEKAQTFEATSKSLGEMVETAKKGIEDLANAIQDKSKDLDQLSGSVDKVGDSLSGVAKMAGLEKVAKGIESVEGAGLGLLKTSSSVASTTAEFLKQKSAISSLLPNFQDLIDKMKEFANDGDKSVGFWQSLGNAAQKVAEKGLASVKSGFIAVKNAMTGLSIGGWVGIAAGVTLAGIAITGLILNAGKYEAQVKRINDATEENTRAQDRAIEKYRQTSSALLQEHSQLVTGQERKEAAWKAIEDAEEQKEKIEEEIEKLLNNPSFKKGQQAQKLGPIHWLMQMMGPGKAVDAKVEQVRAQIKGLQGMIDEMEERINSFDETLGLDKKHKQSIENIGRNIQLRDLTRDMTEQEAAAHKLSLGLATVEEAYEQMMDLTMDEDLALQAADEIRELQAQLTSFKVDAFDEEMRKLKKSTQEIFDSRGLDEGEKAIRKLEEMAKRIGIKIPKEDMDEIKANLSIEKQAKEYERAQQRAAEIAKSNRTPQEEYNDTVRELNELMKDNAFTSTEYNRAMEAAAKKLEKAEKQALGAANAVQKFDAALSDSAEAQRRISEFEDSLTLTRDLKMGKPVGWTWRDKSPDALKGGVSADANSAAAASRMADAAQTLRDIREILNKNNPGKPVIIAPASLS